MDVYLWSLLCHHSVHSFFPQLPDLVFSWPRDDHLYCLVHGYSSSCPWPGIIYKYERSSLSKISPMFRILKPLLWSFFWNNFFFLFTFAFLFLFFGFGIIIKVKVWSEWISWFLIYVAAQVAGVTHSAPTKLVLYFTGATNILYTFGGHAVTV